MSGLLRGAFRGLLGALIRPLDGLLDTSARIADAIRIAVMGPPVLATRIRPPRYVSQSASVAVYDWSEVRPWVRSQLHPLQLHARSMKHP